MAVTLTPQQLAYQLRLIADTSIILEEPQLTVLNQSLGAAARLVLNYAPNAPNDVHNEAVTRIAGYLYDVPPGSPRRNPNPMRDSGALAILSGFHVQRAQVITPNEEMSEGSALKQILFAHETTGDSFVTEAGIGQILLSDHSGGTWTLQVRSPSGDWLDTDATWTGNGIRSFDAQADFPYRMNGGTAGALAWYAPGGGE